MSRRLRTVVFFLGAIGFAVLFTVAVCQLPPFGGPLHPYRDAAVAAAVRHSTANVISSVNFDLRGLDTLGEEMILLGSVVGAAALLRSTSREHRQRRHGDRVLPAARVAGAVMLPVTTVLGIDLIAHGHLTPGGGFQGGVVAATGVHLLYIAGRYEALRRLRPVDWYEFAEAFGGGLFLVVGLIGLFGSTGMLADFLPTGSMSDLASAGTVVVLNAAVGVAVTGGIVVLLAQFLEAEAT
ncbi:MnhB domain-containing protein [Fodinicola acaciae]|uniref:MnhB domain-containing protein n=1 Tax=Fodinicola acaciae TaxID=2681555 RepID=UPI0013D8B074|nr:MnhB domain-containing protein [Fodinicola acaciae]